MFAANTTRDTSDLMEEVVSSEKLANFALENRLNLSDNTGLIRLAIINLIKNLPNTDEVLKYKAALSRPREFDYFLIEFVEEELDSKNTSK